MRDLRNTTHYKSIGDLLLAVADEHPERPFAARVELAPSHKINCDRIDSWLDHGQITTASVSFSRENHAAPLERMSSDFEIQGQTWPFLLSGDKARHLVSDGYTMVISGPELWDTDLRQASLDFTEATSVSINTIIFLTPPGVSGFHQHRDRDDCIVIVQTEGVKNWRIYDAPPPCWTEDDDTRPDADAISAELRLEVGDVLAIPRGWGHAASPTSAEPSVHVSFGLNYLSSGHLFRMALISALRGMHHSATMEDTEGLYRDLRDEFEASDASQLLRDFVSSSYRTNGFRLRDLGNATD